jgi:predicted nuclease of predicted toxin-antitoxin system
MKFKLDENIGNLGQTLLRAEGYDVMTVSEQKLEGTPDFDLYTICLAEQRILVTLDLDFSEVLRFPPEPTAGIIVLRTPGRLSILAIVARMRELAIFLRQSPISHELWIVEPGRVRIHQRRD